jgi:hypothetical protein
MNERYTGEKEEKEEDDDDEETNPLLFLNTLLTFTHCVHHLLSIDRLL